VDSINLGTIKNVPIQQVWQGEATVFTPWLANNLQYLAEELGMELVSETTEVPVGDLSADIVARDLSTGRLVVIENQFGRSDHRHLGQILTYAACLGANTVVLVAESIRPGHRTAIDLLNRGMKSILRFYAVEIRIIQIDNSRPAFTLDVICEPEENEGIASGSNARQPSEKEQQYLAFFQSLIDELYNRQFTRARKALPQSWYTFSSENSKVFTYSASFAKHSRVRAEVSIECGNVTMNKQIFDALMSERKEIESAMGSELTWERLDSRKSSRIAIYRPGRIDSSSEELEEIKQWAITELELLRKAFPLRVEAAWQALGAKVPDDETI